PRNEDRPGYAIDLILVRLPHVVDFQLSPQVDSLFQLNRGDFQRRGLELSVLRKLSHRNLRRGWSHAAELFVINELRHRRMRAADRAVRVLPEFQLTELHPQGVDDQKSADERLADAKDQLDRFHGLN